MRPLIIATVVFAAIIFAYTLALSALERAAWDADNAHRIMEIEQ